jgi:hypothetical protein
MNYFSFYAKIRNLTLRKLLLIKIKLSQIEKFGLKNISSLLFFFDHKNIIKKPPHFIEVAYNLKVFLTLFHNYFY